MHDAIVDDIAALIEEGVKALWRRLRRKPCKS